MSNRKNHRRNDNFHGPTQGTRKWQKLPKVPPRTHSDDVTYIPIHRPNMLIKVIPRGKSKVTIHVCFGPYFYD